jgi:dTMP kinase
LAAGRFITFEGGEGAGKSTQVERLAGRLRAAGVAVSVTREPGGTPGAEAIRTLLLHGGDGAWLPATESLLHYAARCEHLERAVRPALAAGTWVISDRFADSTMAYQAGGLGMARSFVARLHRLVCGDFAPDLTFILDLPVDVGLRRILCRNTAADRYERLDAGFHERVRAAFLAIGRQHPERCLVVDATPAADVVGERVRQAVAGRFGIELYAP